MEPEKVTDHTEIVLIVGATAGADNAAPPAESDNAAPVESITEPPADEPTAAAVEEKTEAAEAEGDKPKVRLHSPALTR